MAGDDRRIYIQTQNLTVHKSAIAQMNVIQQGDEQEGNEAEGLVEGDAAAASRSRQQPSEFHRRQGWVKITDGIFMDKNSPLKKGFNVFKGRRLFAGEWREVAIKLIPYANENFKEARLLVSLGHHQNIVRIYDANEYHEGLISYIYIVMELCQQTLKEYIDENKENLQDFKNVFSYAEQIVSGVAHIHQNNILHRDIKLENILISSDGRIRIADFGLSKQILEGASMATVSSPGLGTEGYRAPEMLHDNPKASFYSDAFSLGIVLCQLFSNGRHPFGPDRYRWRTNILDNKGKDLSQIRHFPLRYAEKRAQLCDLVGQSLNFNPRLRKTPQEMLQLPFFAIKLPDRHNPEKIFEIFKNFPCIDFLKREANELLDGFSAEQVVIMGRKLRAEQRPVRAAILFRMSIDFHAKEGKPADDRMEFIRRRADDVYDAISPLSRDVGVGLLKEMLYKMRSVEGASEKVQADCEVRCLFYISNFVELPEEEIRMWKEGVYSLIKRFAGNYEIKGRLLLSLAGAYQRLSQYEKAKKYIEEAVQVFEESSDHGWNERWRKLYIDAAKQGLVEVQKDLESR